MKAASRVVKQVINAVEQAEGQGARVRRAIGNARLDTLDPFLLV